MSVDSIHAVSLAGQVYQDIVTEIYTGELVPGDTLPPLPELCEKYYVGRNTMRAALQMLQENGYILNSPGKRAEVIYDLDNPERQKQYIQELSNRKDAILDAYETLAVLMPDILAASLQRASAQDIAALLSLLEDTIQNLSCITERELFRVLHRLYRAALCLSQNPLMTDLYEALFRFVQIPLSGDLRMGSVHATVKIIRLILRELGKRLAAKDVRQLKKMIAYFCRMIRVFTNTRLTRLCAGVSPANQVQLIWVTGREQDYLYARVVADTLKKINEGRYRPGDSLPSYADLAKQFAVSEKTSRKAISILQQLQIVKTANGRRAKICSRSEHSHTLFLHDEFLRRNCLMFLKALHIVTIICKTVVGLAVPHLDREKMRHLQNNLQPEPRLSLEALLNLIVFSVPSPTVRHVCLRLNDIMAWGAFLEFFSPSKEIHSAINQFVLDVARLLPSHNSAQIGSAMADLFRFIFAHCKQFILDMGIYVPFDLEDF